MTHSIVCISPQDWDIDLPTNRQQIMRQAARRGHQVLFVETGSFLGRQLWQLVRGPGRRSLLRRLLTAETVAPGIRVRRALNPLPRAHTHELALRVGAAVTAPVLRRLARRLPGPRVLWLYDPAYSLLAGRCGEDLAVYDCVDDYAAVAGPDPRQHALITRGDERAAVRSRVVFTVSTSLFERHRGRNPNTHLVPNVGDFPHFAPAADRRYAAPDVRDLRGPVIGFAGNLIAYKVDFDLLEHLARERPEWTLLLVGPVRPDAEAGLARLTRLPNVRWVGARPYAEVPRYVAAFDVGICPYHWTDALRSGFPLKVYEYLAAGKPVVASGSPDLLGMEPDVLVPRGAEAFMAAVERALACRSEVDRARRVALASRNTWDTRAERLLGLVDAELGS